MAWYGLPVQVESTLWGQIGGKLDCVEPTGGNALCGTIKRLSNDTLELVWGDKGRHIIACVCCSSSHTHTHTLHRFGCGANVAHRHRHHRTKRDSECMNSNASALAQLRFAPGGQCASVPRAAREPSNVRAHAHNLDTIGNAHSQGFSSHQTERSHESAVPHGRNDAHSMCVSTNYEYKQFPENSVLCVSPCINPVSNQMHRNATRNARVVC